MLIKIDYTNYQGKREWRVVRPTGQMLFKSSAWHPEPQWIIRALDIRRNVMRDFALKDIHQIVIPTDEELVEIEKEVRGLQEPANEGTTLTS